MLSVPKVPKTLAAHRLMLLEQSANDVKVVVDFFVQQRKRVTEERNQELGALRAIDQLTNSRAHGYITHASFKLDCASQLQRVAKKSKKKTDSYTKSDTHASPTSVLVSALISHTEQQAKTRQQMAKHYLYISRLVKDRIDALTTIYKKCDDGAGVLHDAVRTVIGEFETTQRDYLASSEQLQVAVRRRSQLADNLTQGRVPPDEVEEAQEDIREMGSAVAQLQRRFDVNLESCTLAVAAANAAVEKLDENLAELMSCTKLGEEGWKQAILNRLESVSKTDASLPESASVVATVASLREQLQLTKGGKSGGSGKEGGQEGATGTGDGRKDGSITLRRHFHIRHLPNDTSKANFDRSIGFNYDNNIAALRSEQATRERHISELAVDINALWKSGVMFEGNEQCLLSSDTLRLQRLLHRWKDIVGNTHTDDDGQDNISEKETEDPHEQQEQKLLASEVRSHEPHENEVAPLQRPSSSSATSATASPKNLAGGVASLKWMVNTCVECVTEHVLRGNQLARLEAQNALLPRAPKAGSSSSQNQPPSFPFLGVAPHGESECGRYKYEDEGEYNEENSGDGSESNGEQSTNASVTDGETGEATLTHAEVEERNLLSYVVVKAVDGFGIKADWADNAFRVQALRPDGPASHRLTVGDKIVFVNGKRLSAKSELNKLLREIPIGGKLELRYSIAAEAEPDHADGDVPSEAAATPDAPPDNAKS